MKVRNASQTIVFDILFLPKQILKQCLLKNVRYEKCVIFLPVSQCFSEMIQDGDVVADEL